jgi:tetratricopeptide (TPR) repeat protein
VNKRIPVAVALVLGCFALASCARLNLSVALDPDGTEFLLLARSMATGNGYRDISRPDWPVHTLRPPGFPLLLVPAMLVAPYNVVAAKLTVVFLAAATLFIFWRLASSLLGPGPGLIVFLLMATSPETLTYATDIFSEIPYLVCTLGAMLLATRHWSGPCAVECTRKGSGVFGLWKTPSVLESPITPDPFFVQTRQRLPLIACLALVAFAPLVRAVGLAFVAAAFVAALWSAGRSGETVIGLDRCKRALLALATCLPALVWSVRNAWVDDSPGYAAQFWLPHTGGLLAWALGSLAYYADALSRQIIWGVPTPLGIALAVVPAAGMLLDRRSVGMPALAYYALYLAVVAVYPYRHARLAWPLVPLALVWSTRVVLCGWQRWGGANRMAQVLRRLFLAVIALWIGFQAALSGYSVAMELGVVQQPPPLVTWWSPPPRIDCRSAGEWLRENSPEYSRVLTRAKSLFLWSRRGQYRVRFETADAQAFQQMIQDARAQYLALNESEHGALLPLERLSHDPVYRFDQVYRGGGVLICRVEINRSGTVPQQPVDYSSILKRLESEPEPSLTSAHRNFLRAHFLRRARRAGEAIPILRELLASSEPDVVTLGELATCLIEVGEFEEAIAWYERATQLAMADLYRDTIASGIEVARRFLRFHDSRLPVGERMAAGLDIAVAHLRMGRYQAGMEQVEACLELDASSPPAWYVKGQFLYRLGRAAEAEEACQLAARGGVREALPKLMLLQTAQALEGTAPVEFLAGDRRYTVDPRTSEDFLNLVTLAVRDGIPGFAVATLERARERFPDDVAVMQRLGELYEFYGQWTLAEAEWSRALEIERDLDTASRLTRLRKQMAPHRAP